MMLGNNRFVEACQVAAAYNPVDVNGAAQTGDWISLKNFHRCAVIIFGDAGSSGTDITITAQQATDVSGSGAKALNFTRVDKKEGADIFAIGQFTTVEQAAANTFTTTNNEQSDQIYVLDFGPDDLDVDGGFDCIRITQNAGNASKLMAGLYIPYGPKVGTDPLPSVIAD